MNQIINFCPDETNEARGAVEVCEVVHPRKLMPPSPRAVNAFMKQVPGLFQGRGETKSQDRYGFNWLNLDDYLLNWNKLPVTIQSNIHQIIHGDWVRKHPSCGGLKTPKTRKPCETQQGRLAGYLLLLAGLEIGNFGYPHGNIIESNILSKDSDYRPRNRTDQWWIDPRAANHAIVKLKREYDFKKLMAGNHALKLLFEREERDQYLGDSVAERMVVAERFQAFFRENEGTLVRWKDRKFISAYFASHEISYFSIQDHKFRPHTHAIIWFNPDANLDFIKRVRLRSRILRMDEQVSTAWNEIQSFISYTLKVARLQEVYEREFRELGAGETVRFNVKTVQAVRNMQEIWKSVSYPKPKGGRRGLELQELWSTMRKPKRRLTHGGVPKKSN